MAIVAKYLCVQYSTETLSAEKPANKDPKSCPYGSHYHGDLTVAPWDNVEPLCIWTGNVW